MPTSPAPRSSCRRRYSSTRPTSEPSAPGASSPPRLARPARSTAAHTPPHRCSTSGWPGPLLAYPLAGPVYLGSSTHKLPDLVAALRGPASQPIEVALAGKTDAVQGPLRNTFEAVPDVPVTKFSLTLFGDKKGLIIMSDGVCARQRATADFV